MITQFNINQFIKDGESFFSTLIDQMRALNIDVKPETADHLCFRVNTAKEYDFYKAELLKHSQLLTEAQVKGRPICTFKIPEGFTYKDHLIELLELPYPKENSDYATGFEHAEFVLTESFEKFQLRHPSTKFKIAGNKNLNPELCVKTAIGGAKFHYAPLSRVIEIEEAKITHVISTLENLKSLDFKTIKPSSVVFISHDPAQIKVAKAMNVIAAAALWNQSARIDELIAHGAEIFFYEESELKTWLA